MNDMDKLRALLPHWLEHNKEHAIEFRNWADRACLAGQAAAAQEIYRAAEAMQQANDALQSALTALD